MGNFPEQIKDRITKAPIGTKQIVISWLTEELLLG